MRKERKSFLLVVYNRYGQLGLGHCNRYVTVPAEIPAPAAGFTLIDVRNSAMVHFSLMKMEREKLFACGDNYYGRLGLGHIVISNSTKEIPTPAAQLALH